MDQWTRKAEFVASAAVIAVMLPICLAVAHWSWGLYDAPVEVNEAAIYEDSIASRGDNVDPNSAQTYRAHYNAGYQRMSGGYWLSAIKHYRYCLDNAPRGSVPWSLSCMQMGVISERMGMYDRADKLYAEYMRYGDPTVRKARSSVKGAWRAFRLHEENKNKNTEQITLQKEKDHE